MTTLRRRKVWQHDTEYISEDQMRECCHRLGWLVDRFGNDYGEDLFVRICQQGVFFGKAFFVQLKGTSSIQQYALKTGVFSYGVAVVNLLQWYRNQFPVIFVLWDIENRIGYWLHIQPYVEQKLKHDPNWLKDETGTRNIHISPQQILQAEEYLPLFTLITEEFQKVSLGRQLLEQQQSDELNRAARQLLAKYRSEDQPFDDQPLETTPQKGKQVQAFIPNKMALPLLPDTAEGWMKLASRYYTQHDYERAMAAINKAKNLGAAGVHYAMIHGSILTEYAIAQGGRRKSLLHEAIALFESASSQLQYPEKASAEYNIGNALSALGNYTAAIERYDAALTANPRARLAAQIWKNRGTAYYHLDNHEEEFASYQSALALNPHLWEAYTSWAVTENRLGNYAYAKELYLEALKVYPELAVQHSRQIYGLALVCWKLGEHKLSYQYVNQMLSVRPDDEATLHLKRQLLSTLWRKDGQYIADALMFFRMWLLDNPADMFVRRELYLLYRAQADKQQMSDLLTEATSIVNTSPQSLYYYACILVDEGKIPGAIDALEKAFQQNQGHNIVHKLADLKKQTGKYREAIRLYKLIVADNELHVLQSIADCYHYLKQHDVCVWCCTRAIQLDPSQEAWWNNLTYSLMVLEKRTCTGAVEKLRMESMHAVSNEEPSPSPSEFAQLLLQTIEAEFGKPFVDSVLAPSPPF